MRKIYIICGCDVNFCLSSWYNNFIHSMIRGEERKTNLSDFWTQLDSLADAWEEGNEMKICIITKLLPFFMKQLFTLLSDLFCRFPLPRFFTFCLFVFFFSWDELLSQIFIYLTIKLLRIIVLIFISIIMAFIHAFKHFSHCRREQKKSFQLFFFSPLFSLAAVHSINNWMTQKKKWSHTALHFRTYR